MIKIKLAPYCDQCPHLEIECKSINNMRHEIQCKNKFICKRAYNRGIYDANRKNAIFITEDNDDESQR